MKRHSIPGVVVGLIPAAFLLAGCSPPAAAVAPQPGQLPAAKAEKGEQKTLEEAVKRLKSSKAEEGVAGATALGKLEMKASRIVESSEDRLHTAVIDTAHGFAYFGTWTKPGKVVKIRLADLTRVGAIVLTDEENYLASSAIDVAGGFAYFGTETIPGRIIKIRLSDFTRVGSIALDNDVERMVSAVMDAASGFVYFGSDQTPGKVVKIRLSDFRQVGTLPLGQGVVGCLWAAAIDTTHGFAYFGTFGGGGVVFKVRLSDFTCVRTIHMARDEPSLGTAVIDRRD